MELKWGSSRIHIIQGDITDQHADAIVNAANSSLMGGGGVDGAIHRKGGPQILEECRQIRESDWPEGLPTGSAAITRGGNLRARYVIHTVGPVWRGGHHGEREVLGECYRSSLRLAREKGLTSVVFPSISTGAYSYPISDASVLALRTVKELVEGEGGPADITFMLFDEHDLAVYVRAASEL